MYLISKRRRYLFLQRIIFIKFLRVGLLANIDDSHVVGRGGALVEAMLFDRRVVGSNPALAAT